MDNWKRVADDSPMRCQGVIPSKGQCNNAKVEGSEFCLAHGGRNARDKLVAERKRIYNVELFQQKLNEMEDHSGLKTLHSEIAVLRMILESTLNQCTDNTKLILKSQVISQLVVNIEKLVTSATKLDKQLGSMLDANQAIEWVNNIAEIMGRHIEDGEIINTIVAEMIESYNKIKGEADAMAD